MQEPSESPLPPPNDKQCFNCGKALQNDVALCPHCGAALPTQGSGFKIVLSLLGTLVLSGWALLSGAAGVFSMLVAVSVLNEPNPFINAPVMVLLGFMFLTFAASCIQGVIALTKKREGK